jgi:hypothetical protein
MSDLGTRYMKDNIEDWDFRAFRNIEDENRWTVPGIAQMDSFLEPNFMYVLAVDHVRLNILQFLLDDGDAELTPEGDVILTPSGQDLLPHMTSLRDILNSGKRLQRTIIKSLLREWEKNGRLRLTVLPPNMRETFPGLFDS